MRLTLPAPWQANLAAQLQQAPRQPRQPLWAANGALIGSIVPALAQQLLASASTGTPLPLRTHEQQAGWLVSGNLSASLNILAQALRALGLGGAWRDEQLAVRDDQGQLLGTVERAAVRALGITTAAVHLIGLGRDGAHWIQRRSLTKSNDPGMLDTLMGGMICATDDLHQALARETWEEAGLRLSQLRALRHGGFVMMQRAADDALGLGYMVERIDWFVAQVPAEAQPSNQDGEVDEFLLMPTAQLHQRLLAAEFTLEATAIINSYANSPLSAV